MGATAIALEAWVFGLYQVLIVAAIVVGAIVVWRDAHNVTADEGAVLPRPADHGDEQGGGAG
jgi:hypothetical protein